MGSKVFPPFATDHTDGMTALNRAGIFSPRRREEREGFQDSRPAKRFVLLFLPILYDKAGIPLSLSSRTSPLRGSFSRITIKCGAATQIAQINCSEIRENSRNLWLVLQLSP